MANCNLITTENGTVTHMIDGGLRAALLPDCILDGCGITASGSTITMEAGSFVVCGRIIENVGRSSWTLPVNSTAAALICTIEDETLSFRTEASASPNLTKEDINLTGNTYETIIAICSVADGALTITSKLPVYSRNGGIIFGTSENPPAGSYPEGTLYIQYEA